MTRTASSLIACSFLFVFTTSAQALNTRSFISANGNDANPCTRPLPCRTLQRAHDETNPGGEINMLDPAGYGTLIITKAISIVNDGVGSAGILVPSGGTGITINAGASDKINLRGLIIEGAGSGNTGIIFNSGKFLAIENCTVRNLSGNGIDILVSVSSRIAVSNSFVADNGGDGIRIRPTGSNSIVFAVFNRVEVYNNGSRGIGIFGDVMSGGLMHAIAVDSVAAFNATNLGFFAIGGGAAITDLRVLRSIAFADGIRAEGGAQIWVSQTDLSNGGGWTQATGGAVISYGDNLGVGAPPGGSQGKT
jgi:hypothetical protein